MLPRLSEIRDRLDVWTRHDILLAGMPPLFLVTYFVGGELFTSHPPVIAIAAIITGALILDGLFLHPPSDDTDMSD